MNIKMYILYNACLQIPKLGEKNPRIGKEDDNRQFFKVVVKDYL